MDDNFFHCHINLKFWKHNDRTDIHDDGTGINKLYVEGHPN